MSSERRTRVRDFLVLKGCRMKYLNEISWPRHLVYSSMFLLLAVVPVNRVSAQVLPICSWPFEVTGHGLTNVATPDTNATYWVMPLDTKVWKAMVIRGAYPEARFVNFSTYSAIGSLVDSIIDTEIAPDSDGSENYRIQVSPNAGTSGNNLQLGGSRLAFIVYRVYAPDQNRTRRGGVDLPAVTLVATDGNERTLQPCPFADAESSLSNLIILLRVNGFTDAANFLQGILRGANQLRLGTGSCAPDQPAPTAVTFEIATLGADFFPNPQTTYLETSALCFQQQKVLVVKGRAPVFPNTYYGGSILDPAFDGSVQLRYWSMCNNDRVVPFPVVACQPDYMTKVVLDEKSQAYTYTYVVSDDPAPPTWLPPDATWLPWGATDIPKNLIFRSILPQNSFTLTKDYYPQGVFCDIRALQACLLTAGAQMQK